MRSTAIPMLKGARLLGAQDQVGAARNRSRVDAITRPRRALGESKVKSKDGFYTLVSTKIWG